MVQIERLRVMAAEAIQEYQRALAAGGEPTYPQWADDIFAVCLQAEATTRFPYEALHARPLRHVERAM